MSASPAGAATHRVPRTAMAVAASALVGILSACGVPSGPAATTATTDPVAASAGGSPATASSPTPRQICLGAFPESQLLSWAGSTVAEFREYQYGPPSPTRPLAAAFPGSPAETRGAWCGTRVSDDTIRWWAVVSGEEPAKAIDITGPGEGTRRGEAQGPPVVP